MKTIKLEMTITSTEEGREAAGGFVATVNIHGDALKTFIQNNLILAGFLASRPDCEPDDFHVTVEFGPHQHVIDGQVMVTGLWHAFVMQPA